MGSSDVEGKVREILVASGGSRAVAQQRLLAAVQSDPALLFALARPFLKAILGAAIDRATRPRAPQSVSRGMQPLSKEALDAVLGQMGRGIGGAASSPGPGPGSGSGPRPAAARPGAAPRPAAAAPATALQSLGAELMQKAAQQKAGPPPTVASKRHEASMRFIAAAFVKKKETD